MNKERHKKEISDALCAIIGEFSNQHYGAIQIIAAVTEAYVSHQENYAKSAVEVIGACETLRVDWLTRVLASKEQAEQKKKEGPA